MIKPKGNYKHGEKGNDDRTEGCESEEEHEAKAQVMSGYLKCADGTEWW